MDPNTQLSTEELEAKIHEAVFAGNSEELDKLMSAESAEPAQTTEVVVEEQTEVGEEQKDPPQKTDENTSEVTDSTKTEPDIDPKLKEELERLRQIEHRWKSDMGRTPALQRKLAEYERELQELKAKTSAPAKTNKAAERLAQLKEIDPAMAELMEEIYGELRSEVEVSRNSAKELMRERETEELLRLEAEKLTQWHPQAFDVFERPEWAAWKARQTPGVVALAESMYADDVIKAFEYFARDMNLLNPQPAQVAAPAQQQPAPAAVDSRAVQAEEERKRKLAAPVSGKPVVKESDGLPTDPEKLHDYYYKQALKEMGIVKPK